jgi:DNA-binding transcriptional MerR regulator
LARRIHHLLSNQGYTVRGVQKLLREQPNEQPPALTNKPATTDEPAMFDRPRSLEPSVEIERLIELRDRLRDALTD